MKKSHTALVLLITLLVQISSSAATIDEEIAAKNYPALFVRLIVADGPKQQIALKLILDNWQPGFIPMALETITLMRDPMTAIALIKTLQTKTGQDYRFDINRWYEWLWQQDRQAHPGYAEFKSRLYALIDHRFQNYFDNNPARKIRLDEVRWGGVVQDGIPPLRSPKMISAEEAGYLEDDNIVFGIAVNGDVRAYPKRILAWHEMFTDTVGETPVAGVYCTLCGSMIVYETHQNGTQYELGTSGFLFRSNKLMYDKATQSLWNTMWGSPVVGPLAENDKLVLKRVSVVTTTWGEWRRRHPQTQVLSLDTGHDRDYGEGVAYQDYFASDELMFTVPSLDTRLKNKAQVLGLLFDEYPDQPLAISSDYLSDNPIHHETVGHLKVVIITDRSGANRVYRSADHRFVRFDGDRTLADATGNEWILSEDGLQPMVGERLARLPAHRAFWFGWYSAFPHTRLIH